MTCRILQSISIFVVVFTGCMITVAQQADNKTGSFSKTDNDDETKPKGFFESMQKMRIDKEKKDFQEMLERGEKALKLSEQLEKSFSQTGLLTEKERSQAVELEKLAKKIRSELGGDDDDGEDDPTTVKAKSMPLADVVRTLKDSVGSLYQELKKTTRFSISAAAIQSSNAVLRLTRILKLSK